MDPQQRLQLELVYEALENGTYSQPVAKHHGNWREARDEVNGLVAGIPMEHLVGSDTAVYCGLSNRDYDRMLLRDPDDIPLYHTTGNGPATLANRISYVFDLKGPSVTLDTGCSASMVALHQACQSLRTGESKQAIVGAANLILDPDIPISMSMLK